MTVLPSPRELYLELMVRVLANTIYGDPSNLPDNAAPYRPHVREVGMDWPVIAHTMVGVRRLQNLRMLAQRVLDEGVEGHFMEAGVWRGGCCILMRAVLAANGVLDRRVFVADSFEGLPPPDPKKFPSDDGWDLSGHDALAVSLDTVRENFSRYGLLDEQVKFVPGFFADSLPHLNTGPLALLRLDGDLYESTYISLLHLYPRLSSGGVIIIDDMNFLPPCRQAVLDYRKEQGIETELNVVDWSASWWVKR